MAGPLLHQAKYALACVAAVVRQLEALGPALDTLTAEPPIDHAVRLQETAARILAFLLQQPDRVTVTRIKAGVVGKDKYVAPALAELQQQGKADSVPGSRNAQMWAATTEAIPSGLGAESRNS